MSPWAVAIRKIARTSRLWRFLHHTVTWQIFQKNTPQREVGCGAKVRRLCVKRVDLVLMISV
jgi:hypothetical protein